MSSDLTAAPQLRVAVDAEVAQLRAQVAELRAQNASLRARNDELDLADARFRRLLESQIIGVLIGSADGQILAVNGALESILGRSSAQLERIEWRECVPPEEFDKHGKQAQMLWATGACPAWETAFLRPDGARVPVMTGATLVSDAGDGGQNEARTMLMWAVDISERKRAEDELRASAEQRRAIIESLHDGLLLTDLDDNITYANGRICEMTGYSVEELVGDNAYKLLTDSECWRHCQQRNAQRARGIGGTYEIPIRHRDGSTRWMLINGSPLRDASGTIVGTVGAHSDITERKRDEVERARFARNLENSNRDLETFAFAVSHDLKQPLRKIEVFGSRLEREEGDRLSEQGQLYVARMGDAARRMSALIDGLLAYSRVATAPPAWSAVNLNEIAREVLLDLELAIERAGADVTVGELPTVRADATQMRQLLQNLIGNALDYRREEVPLRVRVSGAVEAGECRLEVADNGRGFAPDHAELLFEIFRRLDNAATPGTGVGLTICRAIVARHGGTLTAHGTPGHGAIFRARFPLAPPASVAPASVAPATVAPKRNKDGETS